MRFGVCSALLAACATAQQQPFAFDDEHMSLLQVGVKAKSMVVPGTELERRFSSLEEFQRAYGSFFKTDGDTHQREEHQLLELMSLYRPCATCTNSVHVGGQNDGGYMMCEEALQGIKGVYSLGIHNEDSFGGDLSSRLNVTAYQYDCFDRRAPQCAKPGCNFEFHALCIGGQKSSMTAVEQYGVVCGSADESCKKAGQPVTVEFDTLSNQMAAHGHREPRSERGDLLMEMDIEGSEWEILSDPSIVPYLKQFQQIIVEFHAIGAAGKIEQQLQAMRNLLQNFVVVHFHGNNCNGELQVKEFHMPLYTEVTLVNRAILPAGSCDANPKQVGDKNVPDKPDLPDALLPGGAEESWKP